MAVVLLVLLASCNTIRPLTLAPHPFRGVNTAGSEMVFGQANTDNPTSGQDFLFVSNQDIDYLSSKNVGFIRLLVSWEGLQPVLNQTLSSGVYMQTLQARVTYATGKGMNVLIEPHGGSDVNFARWKGNLVGSAAVPNSAFANFWTQMANQFKSNPRVMYGLSNEPNNMSTMQWYGAAQAAITGIRSTGSTQMIFVPGNGWTGAGSWTQSWYDTASPQVSNATAWLGLKDPANNLVASVHLYLDANAGGGAPDIVSPTIGVERLSVVVNWAKANNIKVHMSEIGAMYSNAVQAQPALQNLFDYIQANNTTVIGFSWWAYGPPTWWSTNPLYIGPPVSAGVPQYTLDDPKMAWIAPYLTQPPPSGVDASPPPVVDAAPPVVVDASPPPTSSSFPTKPIAFTKGTVFTTNSGQTNWVYVPTSYDSTHNTPTTLFVWLHGCGGQNQYDVSMVSPGGTQSWISLAPGGREGSCWTVGTDTSIVLGAIADLKTHFNINPNKVILGGYSSGGDLTYRVAFYNANMFAGVIVENSSPFRDTGSSQAASLAAASWKFNTVQLSHTSDTTYPPGPVQVELAAMTAAGFPTTYIQKAGTHYDADNGAFGTSYDLRTFELPFINAGWVSPGGVTPPPPAACVYTYSAWGACQSNSTQTRTVTGSTPVPCTASAQTLSQSCTYVPPPVDAGVADAGPVDSGTPDAGSTVSTLVITSKVTYNWGTGYCKEFYFTNKGTTSATWSKVQLNMNGGTVRDQNNTGKPWDTWGGDFSGRTGILTIKPASWNGSLTPGTKATIGLCGDFGPLKWTDTYVNASLLK